jgi:hypothetical protein
MNEHKHQQRGCLGKYKFPAQANAEDARFSLYGVRSEEYNTYRCQFCHKWHIGRTQKDPQGIRHNQIGGNQHGIHR